LSDYNLTEFIVLLNKVISSFKPLFVLVEVAMPEFIMQYDLRPNRLFVEYLNYPQEVFKLARL